MADVENEHKEAMKDFPVQIKIGTKVIQHRSYSSVGSNKLKARLNGNGR